MKNEVLEEENKYFEEVKQITQKLIEENLQRINQIETENHELRVYMLDNIELDNDSGDIDYSAVVLSEKMRANAELQTESLKQNIRLEKIKHNPFFGKITIQEDELENYYIGLQNIKQNTNLYVVDWRAPICSLYYYSNLGSANYTANGQQITTNLTLKRQFEVENGQIVNYFDTDEKINDKLLLNILAQKTSAYMQNIVKSIQTEQNSVIRENISQNVVVQGIAGSGKTSIAMHRIAYLLYDNKDLISENIYFISPNKLFTKYVSRLLPELGEDNVPCYTMTEILNSSNYFKIKIEPRTEFIEQITSNSIRKAEFEIKFGIDYLNKVNEFLINLLCKENIYKIFEPVVPLNYEVLNKIFYTGANPYLVLNRFETIMQRFCDYYALKKTKSDRLKAKLLTSYKKFFNSDALYQEFMQSQGLNSNTTHYDNFATYLFFTLSINGFTPDSTTKHIVVDEMQDYDMLSYQLLKLLYSKATFTILGDTNQNLLVDTNNLFEITKLYEAKQINLEISYRSTKNIMEYANNILGQSTIHTSLRAGEKVFEKDYATIQDLIFYLNKEIEISISDKEKTAIIVFDNNIANKLTQNLKNIALFVNENEQNLESEIVLTSPFMAKGLEFDKVIIVKDKNFDNSTALSKKTLYVSLTRALHKAIILSPTNKVN